REELVAGRRGSREPEDRLAVVAERDREREDGIALRVVVRAVQRVDDPQPAVLRVARRARTLLREHAMLWKLGPQPLENGALHGEVRLGHEVPAALAAHLPAYTAGPPGEAVDQD